MITNISIRVCQRRAQTGEPSFFVNYMEDGINKYEFFQQRFALESFKNRLEKNKLTSHKENEQR